MANPRETEILVFRHGETDWNKQLRWQGHTDIPLNELGLAQAEELASQVEPLAPEIILTSDLARAKQTAEIVNRRLHVSLIQTTELRECHLGDLEGWLRPDVISTYGEQVLEQWFSVKAEDLDFGFPNGETKREHLARLIAYIESFCRANPRFRRIAVSTHGAALRRIVHHCTGAPTNPISAPNCGLYLLKFEHSSGEWIYVRSLC